MRTMLYGAGLRSLTTMEVMAHERLRLFRSILHHSCTKYTSLLANATNPTRSSTCDLRNGTGLKDLPL